MKKTTLLTLLFLASLGLFSQSAITIEYYNWSNPTTFNLSPSPVINGYGVYSDSLSKAYNGKTFYEYNNEYYCIESWADYYYWFTQAFRYKFEDPQLYEYYYFSNDDYGMASYIASNKYLGKYYPSNILLTFKDKSLKNNRLQTDKFITSSNQNKLEVLNDELTKQPKESNVTKSEEFKHQKSPDIFNREDSKKTRLENNPYSNEAPEATKSKPNKTKNKTIK